MGKTEDGHNFCDRCFGGQTEAYRKAIGNDPQFYRCAKCPETDRPLMCVRCVARHYRSTHPELWMEWVVPVLNQKRKEEEKNESPEKVY